MRILVEHRWTSGVPLLEVYNPDIEEKKPMIFVLPGSGQRKEHLLIDAYMFAKEGFFIVIFDACGHGELGTREAREAAKRDVRKSYDSHVETSNNLNYLIETYKQNPHADVDRVGLLGFSLGGSTIYYNVTRERLPNIKAAVPVVGNPFWAGSLRKKIEKIPDWEQVYGEQEIQAMEEYIKSIDPLEYKSNLADLPLLMLYGELDEGVPIDAIRSFYKELEERYTDKSCVEFIEFKGYGHKLRPEDVYTRALSWFKEYL